jgi:hypothetical protein
MPGKSKYVLVLHKPNVMWPFYAYKATFAQSVPTQRELTDQLKASRLLKATTVDYDRLLEHVG